MAREAMLYEPGRSGRLHCRLCAHGCRIRPGQFGSCGVRQHIDGRLITHAYGKAVALNVDPIEKKPLYHFLPGSLALSVGTVGCNFQCGFCQNWQISQVRELDGPSIPGRRAEPAQLVEQAQAHGCRTIAYTYNEPTIFFEYAYDTAVLAHQRGLHNIFVTNGYMTAEALETIAPVLDAANVDLKAFSDDFYRRSCGASLQPVLETIRRMRELGLWLEVTTLVVPGSNDSAEELGRIAGFIAGVDRAIPWHISRFRPDHEAQDLPATPLDTLHRAFDIGKRKGLKYVYLGNVPGWETDTLCPACGEPIIRRSGMLLDQLRLEDGHCPVCRAPIDGLFDGAEAERLYA